MATAIAPYLYTEARLNIEPTFPNSTLHIPTEPTGLFSSTRPKRTLITSSSPTADIDQDEESYARARLATESSIFFRRGTRSPRSFLWRILQDRHVLEIQCVDLAQSKRLEFVEGLLTFSVSFAQPIRANGVAFADPEHVDALEVFVLTTGNELFTVTLSKGVLVRKEVPGSSEFETGSCWKVCRPASFSFKQPYKLVATSSLELFISLHDGGLLRLDRRAGENGSVWRETFFSEGGWASTFRGLIPFRGHNTVRFGHVDLEPATPTAIAMAPDAGHLFTVSLDHNLKAWNMKTGKTAAQTDLLGENNKEHQTGAQYLISPTQGSIMQVVDVEGKPDGDMYYVVTNSPKDHQFKFWGVRDADSVAHGIRDVQSEAKLIPPLDELMNTNVWQLIEFHIVPGQGWRDTQLWIRVRAGAVVKLFTLTFDLLVDPDELVDVWQNNWAAVDEGSLTVEALMSHAQFPDEAAIQSAIDDGCTPTERWLDYLFYPGRFSSATLESALYVYRKGLKLLSESSTVANEVPLKQRLCDAISAKIHIDKTASGDVDFERYQLNIAAQWHTYFGLVRLLHGRRAESLALAYDNELKLPWTVRADFVSPIRTCSQFEIITLNEEIFTTQEEGFIVNSMPLANSLPYDSCVPVARLLIGARTFRRGLSSYFQSSFEQASTADALELSSDKTTNGVTDKYTKKVMQLYNACALHSEVSNEDFDNLTDSMQDLGGLGALDNDIFFAAIQRFGESDRGSECDQVLTRHGNKTTIRGAQETLHRTHDAILDLLALVVFMAGDLEQKELAEDFRPGEIYEVLMAKLKEHKILLWLAGNVRQELSQRIKDADGIPTTSLQPALSIFESIFIGDWPELRFPSETLPALITYWTRAWTYGLPLTTSPGPVLHIFGNLIKHANHDLAADFERFVADGPWTQYLRGRLALATGDFTMAGIHFKNCAQDLARKTFKLDTFDTSNLLKATDKTAFGNGLPRYYMHVSSLYENLKIHTYTADFAGLALATLEGGTESDALSDLDSRKSSMLDSPASAKVDMAMEELKLLRTQELREEILSRIFSASLQTGHFRHAFDALMLVRNPALQKANLTSLLDALLRTSSYPTLLSIPWPQNLVPQITSILTPLARKHLPFSPISSAVPSTTHPSSSAAPPQYHQLLYTWSLHNSDFRAAAQILFERLQLLKSCEGVFAPEDETVVEAYLGLINCLACLGREDGWVLSDGTGNSGRRIVTLEDVRREYQAELDRRSEMEQGRFPLIGGVGLSSSSSSMGGGGVGGFEAMDVF